jgi:hypothetical protein
LPPLLTESPPFRKGSAIESPRSRTSRGPLRFGFFCPYDIDAHRVKSIPAFWEYAATPAKAENIRQRGHANWAGFGRATWRTFRQTNRQLQVT